VLTEISEIPFGNAAFHVRSRETQTFEPDGRCCAPAAGLTVADNLFVLVFFKLIEATAQLVQRYVVG
jgi:hypothetical protein